MKKIRSTAFLCLLLLFSCCSFGQQQKKYLFTRYGKANGLAADIAFCTVQDRQGYIWIGTDRGLQRYDGKKFISFIHNDADPASIAANGIGRMLFDKKGRLWIIMYGNYIGIFNTSTFKYKPVKVNIDEAFKRSDMSKIQEDEDGVIQIRVNGYGLLTYNETTNEFSSANNRIKLSDGGIPGDINRLKTKGQYLVNGPASIDLYDNLTKKWVPRNSNSLLLNMNRLLTEEKAMGPANITTDSKGRIWMNVWLDGKHEKGIDVFSYNPATDSFISYRKSIDIASSGYHTIDGILEQKNGVIWIYGTSLFARFNEEKQIFEDVRNELLRFNGLELESVFDIYEDREANLWISSTNGLFMFNPGRQIFNNFYNTRDDGIKFYTNSIEAVMESRTGVIYSSTWGEGIFAYDSNLNVIPNRITPNTKKHSGYSGWDMHERANGEIWISKQGGSVDIYDPKTKKLTALWLSVFEGRTVRQVAEDSSGNIWMGTQYGAIIKCTNANWHDTAGAFKIVQQLKGRITRIVADKRGFVWVGTDRYGLYKLNISDGSIADHYDQDAAEGKKLKIAGANDILIYNDSLVLIASGWLNILNTKTNKITYINTDNGLESVYIASILKDRNGYLWLTFSDGLCRMELGKNILQFFGYEDGILHNRFQLNAATVLHDGRILLGTTTDMLVFDPSKITLPKKPVQVTISGFQVADRALSVDSLLHLKKISLPYYNNSISIDMTTFSYLNDFAVMYMLEGADKKWLSTSTNRVSYNLLPPGKYIFKAKSVSAYGEESDTITELVIDIIPPFWRTWWFYGLLVLSAISIFYLADRERLLRIKATQKLRTDIALGLHHDVHTNLNNINLLSEMARMKIDRDIPKSKELIGQISDKSNDMIIAMDDMLWVIDPANDSMEKILLRMDEFTDALRNRHEAEIDIQTDERLKELKLEMKLRHGFYFTYKSALRCIVQYAGAKDTLVNIDLQNNSIYLKIHGSATLNYSDSNVSKCWEDMKLYAADINAELDVQNDRAESSITLIIPAK